MSGDRQEPSEEAGGGALGQEPLSQGPELPAGFY